VFLLYISFLTTVIHSYRIRIEPVGIASLALYFILISIGIILLLSCIPFYLPNRSVDVARSNATSMLLFARVFNISSYFYIISATNTWSVQYFTNLTSLDSRAVSPVNTPACAAPVSEPLKIM
jgi:hypothetical protein